MELWYQETGISPKEVFMPGQFTAERTFVLDWERRKEFVSLFLLTGYPGHPSATVQKITLQPLESESRLQNTTYSINSLGTSMHGKAILFYSSVVEEPEEKE